MAFDLILCFEDYQDERESTAQRYRKLYRDYLPQPLPPAESVGPALAAFVNAGRWLVECPECSYCFLPTRKGAPVACCGVWRPVQFPRNRTAVEAALLRVPGRRLRAPLRNWKPGTSTRWLKKFATRCRKLQRKLHHRELLTHASIAPTRKWEFEEEFRASHLNVNVKAPLDDLAGREGLIELEDGLSLQGVGTEAVGTRYLSLPTTDRPTHLGEGTLAYDAALEGVAALGLGLAETQWGALLQAGAVRFSVLDDWNQLVDNASNPRAAALLARGNHGHSPPGLPAIGVPTGVIGGIHANLAPSNNPEITHAEYRYRLDSADDSTFTAWTSTPRLNPWVYTLVEITGLQELTEYLVEFRFVSIFGTGSAVSTTVQTGTSLLLPETPSGLTAIINRRTDDAWVLEVDWQAPNPIFQVTSTQILLPFRLYAPVTARNFQEAGVPLTTADGITLTDGAVVRVGDTVRLRFLNAQGDGPAATATVRFAGDDASLLSIATSPVAIEFAAETLTYDVTLPADGDGLYTVTVRPNDLAASVVIDGVGAPSGERTFRPSALAQGASRSHTVRGEAEDGDDGTVYTLTFTRREPGVVLSSDSSLSALSIAPGTLVPAFDPTVLSYTEEVANSVSSVTVSATANHSAATVSGTGAWALEVGANDRSVVVTAEDRTQTTYTLTVTRQAPPTPGQPPAPPTGLAVSSPRYDQVLASWAVEAGATSETAITTSGQTPAFATASSPQTFGGRTGGTLYQVHVRARNANGVSAAVSEFVRTGLDPTLPVLRLTAFLAEPRAGAAVVGAVGQSGAVGEVRWKQRADAEWPAAVVATLPYRVTGLPNGVLHDFQFRFPGGDWSNTASATPFDAGVYGLDDTPLAGGVRLAWDDVTGVTGWWYRYRTPGTAYPEVWTEVAPRGSSVDVTGLERGPHTFQVQGRTTSQLDSRGYWTGPIRAITSGPEDPPTAPPSNVRVTQVYNGGLGVAWDASANALSYRVWVLPNNAVATEDNVTAPVDAGTLSYLAAPLTNGVQHRVAVQALGLGVASAVVEITGQRPAFFAEPVRLGNVPVRLQNQQNNNFSPSIEETAEQFVLTFRAPPGNWNITVRVRLTRDTFDVDDPNPIVASVSGLINSGLNLRQQVAPAGQREWDGSLSRTNLTIDLANSTVVVTVPKPSAAGNWTVEVESILRATLPPGVSNITAVVPNSFALFGDDTLVFEYLSGNDDEVLFSSYQVTDTGYARRSRWGLLIPNTNLILGTALGRYNNQSVWIRQGTVDTATTSNPVFWVFVVAAVVSVLVTLGAAATAIPAVSAVLGPLFITATSTLTSFLLAAGVSTTIVGTVLTGISAVVSFHVALGSIFAITVLIGAANVGTLAALTFSDLVVNSTQAAYNLGGLTGFPVPAAQNNLRATTQALQTGGLFDSTLQNYGALTSVAQTSTASFVSYFGPNVEEAQAFLAAIGDWQQGDPITPVVQAALNNFQEAARSTKIVQVSGDTASVLRDFNTGEVLRIAAWGDNLVSLDLSGNFRLLLTSTTEVVHNTETDWAQSYEVLVPALASNGSSVWFLAQRGATNGLYRTDKNDDPPGVAPSRTEQPQVRLFYDGPFDLAVEVPAGTYSAYSLGGEIEGVRKGTVFQGPRTLTPVGNPSRLIVVEVG